MALSSPRGLSLDTRLAVADLAVRYHGRTTDIVPDAVLTATADAIEGYLLRDRAGDAPAPDRPQPAAAYEPINREVEDWRIAIERLPLDGRTKTDLDPQQRLYRIEHLASLLNDPGESQSDRTQVIVELRNTVEIAAVVEPRGDA